MSSSISGCEKNPTFEKQMILKVRKYILLKFNAEKIITDFEAKISELI